MRPPVPTAPLLRLRPAWERVEGLRGQLARASSRLERLDPRPAAGSGATAGPLRLLLPPGLPRADR
ncbi:MAG: hypothetical protein ACKOSS_09200 [Planctomycetia bacterium]